eukprot:scaffold256_cov159-Amphora_coffeaeformis.AAC.3
MVRGVLFGINIFNYRPLELKLRKARQLWRVGAQADCTLYETTIVMNEKGGTRVYCNQLEGNPIESWLLPAAAWAPSVPIIDF